MLGCTAGTSACWGSLGGALEWFGASVAAGSFCSGALDGAMDCSGPWESFKVSSTSMSKEEAIDFSRHCTKSAMDSPSLDMLS